MAYPRGRERRFFGTQGDIIAWLEPLEAELELFYVRFGLCPERDPVRYPSVRCLPDLGHTPYPQAILAPTYLITLRSEEWIPRTVPQVAGGMRLAVSQAECPGSVVLRAGGTYGDRCLLEGSVDTLGENQTALKLFQALARRLKQMSRYERGVYLGREACCRWEEGWALTRDATNPHVSLPRPPAALPRGNQEAS